ncbi:alpha/beta hydrolase [Mycolicibacterium palauense]|uniref:alpha/beta hydrolase n=1 Tax=Mycolicibacterium palauense TaxID=2034511 RepID=UPI001FEA97E7|nr:alpha/beta fold hydrolase [Mycolicibacterium palauense]
MSPGPTSREARAGDHTADVAAAVPVPRVVLVDGVPMSGLLAEAARPRATVVALHGGATTAAYFDCPGQPALSLLRSGPGHGFTVLALDRPGFGSSALYSPEFDSTPRRIAMTYRAIDAMLGDRDRGAGLFLLAHSNGSELALRLAADDERGATLLGVEISGTGVRQQEQAAAVLAGASRERIPSGLRELLWEPAELYPDGVAGSVRIKSGPLSPDYEGPLVANWTRDFPELAARVRVPVRYSVGEFERVWANDPAAVTEIAALFTAAPRVQTHRQAGGGHNLSLGFAAAEYHADVLSFAGTCIDDPAPTDVTMEADK